MDFAGREVVVTGGTGALGRAVVATLLKAGAHCHVSYLHEAEAQSFPHKQNVTLHAVGDLAFNVGDGRQHALAQIPAGLGLFALGGLGRAVTQFHRFAGAGGGAGVGSGAGAGAGSGAGAGGGGGVGREDRPPGPVEGHVRHLPRHVQRRHGLDSGVGRRNGP